MQSLEFILIFTLLLGISAAFMHIMSDHTQQTYEKNKEWKNETTNAQCQHDIEQSNARFVLKPTKNCLTLDEWTGWDANHYE